MIRQLIVSISVVIICLSIYPKTIAADLNSVYPTDYSDCEFPFNYKGKTYTNCTTDGDNGNIAWCSLTTNYIGMFTYCYDFTNTTLDCRSSYKVNGKDYSGCNLLSKSAKYKQCKTDNPDFPTIYCPDVQQDAKKKFKKRRRECEKKYKDISKDHTMCFSPSPFAVQVAITENEKQELLDIHNQYRSAVKSAYMFKLYWDDELAKMAQSRGDMCAFDHDLAENRISTEYNWKNGQNMVWSDEIRNSLAGLIDLMLGAEKETFFYGVGCNPAGTCLHYTQAMLSNLTRMGCAHTQCVYRDRIDRYLTCNYIQSQYASKYMTPYVQSSTAASACPSKNSDGLCDCGDKVCSYNAGEYLEPSTCTCKVEKTKRSVNDGDFKAAAPSGGAGNLIQKRSANDGDFKAAAPSGGAGNLIQKRSIKLLKKSSGTRNSIQKRSINLVKKSDGAKNNNN
ncbi:hypothetical protein I4U23_026889 [Adineta vaga]|nr:hypothetical protein I4U23_026889 [Adineta vaga]